MAPEEAAPHREGRPQRGHLLEFLERPSPGAAVGREALAGDRDEPTIGLKTCKGGADMLECCRGIPSSDQRRCRKGRVHQDNTRAQRGLQPIVDLSAIELGDLGFREEPLQQCVPILGPLVQQ